MTEREIKDRFKQSIINADVSFDNYQLSAIFNAFDTSAHELAKKLKPDKEVRKAVAIELAFQELGCNETDCDFNNHKGVWTSLDEVDKEAFFKRADIILAITGKAETKEK